MLLNMEDLEMELYLNSSATNNASNHFNNLKSTQSTEETKPHTLPYIKLSHILYVLEITKNLINISKILHNNNVDIEFIKTSYFAKENRKESVLMKVIAKNGMHKLLNQPNNSNQVKSIFYLPPQFLAYFKFIQKIHLSLQCLSVVQIIKVYESIKFLFYGMAYEIRPSKRYCFQKNSINM